MEQMDKLQSMMTPKNAYSKFIKRGVQKLLLNHNHRKIKLKGQFACKVVKHEDETQLIV
jgi:hypothetical protein